MTKITRNKHIGSNFDVFLRDESLLADVQATAIKRVLAVQIETAMRAQGISKADLSKRLRTSRTQLDRLLGHSSNHRSGRPSVGQAAGLPARSSR